MITAEAPGYWILALPANSQGVRTSLESDTMGGVFADGTKAHVIETSELRSDSVVHRDTQQCKPW